MTETLVVDDLVYHVRRSPKRKTVGITIDRDGSLVLTAPTDCPPETVEAVGREKSFWVYSKLAERELLFRPARKREFVSGEGFYYLGRSYRLLLVGRPGCEPDGPVLRLHEGRFKLHRGGLDRAQNHFRDWYIAHAEPWVERRVALLAPRIGKTPRAVVVRDMAYRWGSCGTDGTIRMNWRTACLPPVLIEYIIAHELVHLLHPHHDDDFWTRLERVIPDYPIRKRRLAETGGRYI